MSVIDSIIFAWIYQSGLILMLMIGSMGKERLNLDTSKISTWFWVVIMALFWFLVIPGYKLIERIRR